LFIISFEDTDKSKINKVKTLNQTDFKMDL